MNNNTHSPTLSIDEFDYPLPDERIAKYPLSPRDSSKLLIYKNGQIAESRFASIADYLPAQSLLMYNNTKVIQARLEFFKATGARIEVFCLEPVAPADYSQSLSATNECTWKCMVGNLKKWKDGELSKALTVTNQDCILKVRLCDTQENTHTIHFSWNNPHIHFADILENAGELPIPPYLHRKTETSDYKNYQTVYSKIKGSVAAPTAGLHFTPEVFEQVRAKGIDTDELTLHVGAGTFQPVKTQDVDKHLMHTEIISVNKKTIEHLQQKLGNIIAVGTTSVRTLESLYYIGCQLAANNEAHSLHIGQRTPYTHNYDLPTYDALQHIVNYMTENNLQTLRADTQIMIKPGYHFRIVDGMITNFHQPKSTLLLLVSAFTNGNWKTIYDYAMNNDFRFLSYGDSSLLWLEKIKK